MWTESGSKGSFCIGSSEKTSLWRYHLSGNLNEGKGEPLLVGKEFCEEEMACEKALGWDCICVCKEQHGSRRTVAGNEMRELVGSSENSEFHLEWMVSQKKEMRRELINLKVFWRKDSSGCCKDRSLWRVKGEGQKQTSKWGLYSNPEDRWFAAGFGARFWKHPREGSDWLSYSQRERILWSTALLKTHCWDRRSSAQRKEWMPICTMSLGRQN